VEIIYGMVSKTLV